MTPDMLKDKRPINRIDGPFVDGYGTLMAQVGVCDVVRIESYGENGEMAAVPWFAVYKADESGKEYISARINAKMVAEVGYKPC